MNPQFEYILDVEVAGLPSVRFIAPSLALVADLLDRYQKADASHPVLFFRAERTERAAQRAQESVATAATA
jgi:hypothetical protein